MRHGTLWLHRTKVHRPRRSKWQKECNTQPPVASEHHSHPVPTPVALYPVGSNQEAALLPAAELSCEGMPERLDPRSSSLQVSWREPLTNEDELWAW